MWARILSLLAVIALAACGGDTEPTVADVVIGPIANFAPNTVSLIEGEVTGYLIRIDDRVALFDRDDPSSGCPLGPLSTAVERPAGVPAEAVFYESCQGNAYSVDGAHVAGSGIADLESLPIYIDQGVVFFDVTPDV